jgi:hypothetical protein
LLSIKSFVPLFPFLLRRESLALPLQSLSLLTLLLLKLFLHPPLLLHPQNFSLFLSLLPRPKEMKRHNIILVIVVLRETDDALDSRRHNGWLLHRNGCHGRFLGAISGGFGGGTVMFNAKRRGVCHEGIPRGCDDRG